MYNEEFWNERYAKDEYLYGVEPNTFLAEHAEMLKGPVLSLSEGEGRNAVFLALKGLDVHGVDISAVALNKMQALAKAKNVKVETEVADLSNFEPTNNHYGSVISIWAHLPSTIRKNLYPLIEQCLKPGGIVLLESYSERQLEKDTGGPRSADMLMTIEKLKQEFPNLEPILLREVDRDVSEGESHSGLASVVQFVACKKA